MCLFSALCRLHTGLSAWDTVVSEIAGPCRLWPPRPPRMDEASRALCGSVTGSTGQRGKGIQIWTWPVSLLLPVLAVARVSIATVSYTARLCPGL